MEEIKVEKTIDLYSKNRGKCNIGTQWFIDVEDKNSIFKHLPKLKNILHIEKTVSVNLENISIDSSIVCDEKRLFVLSIDNNKFLRDDLPLKKRLKIYQTPFGISLDLDAISDCSERQQREDRLYDIKCDVVVRDSKDEIIHSHHLTVSIKFERINTQPDIRIELDADRSTIQYSSELGKVCVGNLVVSMEQHLNFIPDILYSFRLSLFDDGHDCGDIISFLNDNKHVRSLDSIKLRRNTNGIKYPIYLDFTNISNPSSPDKRLTLARTASYSMQYSPEIICPLNEEMAEITILKDKQGTELKVAVKSDDTEYDIRNNSGISIPLKSFVPQTPLLFPLDVVFTNIATSASNQNAGLHIRSLTVSDFVLDNVFAVDSDKQRISSFTKLTNGPINVITGSNGLFLKNGRDAFTTLSLQFDPSKISDLGGPHSDFKFKVETTLSFSYFENKEGVMVDDSLFKTFKFIIKWNLELLPHPEWLCVDYGSSAIVCQYANRLLDLKQQKQRVFKDPENGYSDFTEDQLESNSTFLSSDIVLSPTKNNQEFSSLYSQQPQKQAYSSLSVCLSPTSSLIRSCFNTQLPCLKILVGNEFLPSKSQYKTYQYLRQNEQNGTIERVKAENVKQEPNSLLRISCIFAEAYGILFRYFISSVTGDIGNINKLVLTYPNTYTPVHLSILRGIVQKTFPSIRPGYLRFVSESDAVAAYYVANWNKFNKKPLTSVDKETILIYDMGAGTLDITVFDMNVSNKGRNIEADVRGKIGTGKAGNYLDFVIAEIICEEIGIQSDTIASVLAPPNTNLLMQRLDMKDIVKEKIKPNLLSGKTISFRFAGKDYSIEADDILNHVKFKQFLDEVTANVLFLIEEYLGNNFQIDTVIMSGRSCKLEILRQKLQDRIRLMTPPTKDIHFVTLDGNKEKTIVAEGAVVQVNKFDTPNSTVHVRSRRLYASYGIVFQQVGGRFKYVELLNHSQIPYIGDDNNFAGANITVEGTATADKLILVQTYMSREDTEDAYNDGKMEYISIMEEYDMQNFSNADTLSLRLRLDGMNNISLFVSGMVSRGSSPKGVDLTSNVTKKSIWPVTI